MEQLSSSRRKHLKALAHHLDPVVMVGAKGLTEAVIAEADRALASHELIKMKVAAEDREPIAQAVCEALGCALVQHIGKVLVLYRAADPPRIELPTD
jgi:RNA-binding protein